MDIQNVHDELGADRTRAQNGPKDFQEIFLLHFTYDDVSNKNKGKKLQNEDTVCHVMPMVCVHYAVETTWEK